MNGHINRIVSIFSVFVFIFALQIPVAFAQTTVGLQIKPAIVEDKVNPGELHQYSVTVTNVSADTKSLYVTAQDINGVDDQGRPIFSKSTEVTGYELSSWITIPDAIVTLGSKEAKTVSFSVRVPAGASPGSHFASLFFSDKPNKPDTSGTGVGFDVGAIVSLRISGDITENAQLREFSTGKLIYGTPNVDFHAKVQNLGNILIQPSGVIEISNVFGKKVGSINVNEQRASTFPESNRVYNADWKSDSFAFGRYEALITLAYGDETRKTIYNTTSFWILPLVPIGIGLGALLAIVLAAYLLMRSYIRRKLRQMGVEVPGTNADRMSRKYKKSSSRLMVVTMAVLLLCIVFLVVIFLLFA